LQAAQRPPVRSVGSLERRWNDLIDSEAQYRSSDGRAAASG
jgi:hypothetical protein